ncbi:HAD-IC family P-type ATPase [Methylocystis sp. WRRC1]|uniref:HAD-IC family P-type ATPase n=1 Tax=Methylocystis sp. WRRC1 TaxID=1732014 RepID=UPI001D14813D|nr:HAD-IC family P-type ATPase [Methylocystis sp. WRRC1]MCC3245066.1 HAD-IC family P-type ATPase [Methylocystis sp. WRRC1]
MNVTKLSSVENWHALEFQEALSRLDSDPSRGLSSEEAVRRLGEYGPNRLPEGAKRGPLMRFLHQFDNILVYVLLAAGFIKLMLGLWLDASIITGVVVINALLGFLQEGKAEKALESIRNMLSADARALRDGEPRVVAAENLVPGDIVLMESGDRVPADLRLIDVKNLRADEAALTGESVPADKSTDVVPENSTVGDRADMAFSGTLIVSGRAAGVVVATGAQTELGRINQMLAAVDALETPLLRQIEDFGHTIAKVIGFVSVIVFAYGRWVRDLPFVDAFQAVVGIAVSVIPEGLPALITITLAIGVQRMAQRHAIIRRLPAVETLGSVSRICSDKTGTLTLMEMMVASAITADAAYRVTGDGYASEGQILLDGQPAAGAAALRHMGIVSALCNDSELRPIDNVWKVEGDPTEAALYPFATKLGLDRAGERRKLRRIDAIPFESEHKFMATLHEEQGGERLLLVKGAPEVILAHCDREEAEKGFELLRRDYWDTAADRLAAQGERVLALAGLRNPPVGKASLGPEDLPSSLVLYGLVGLMDPPRKEAVEAVAECHNGGIRVTMITGDHKVTAAAIAKMLGIGDGKTAVAGTEIEAMNDGELQESVENVDVFARASPEHKLRLVKAIQANGQVVAMTGDGVNDAPALKRADIGVAMGIKGTEVTKEAAAMVLADDNFASITAAVREGRTVYNNIEKALLFMLPTNVAQALVILVAIVAGFMLPITAPQILWVNMVTSVALGLVISFEPHELDVMRRAPRAVSRPILDAFAVWRVVFVGVALLILTLVAFFWMKAADAPDELARTVAVNTLVVGQIFYLLNSRFKTDSSLSIAAHLGNRYLPLGIAAVVVLQLLFTYAPPLQSLFGTQAIPMNIWPWLFLGGFVFFLVVEAEKFFVRRFGLIGARGERRSAKDHLASPALATPSRPVVSDFGKWQALLGVLAVTALIAGEIFVFWRGGQDQQLLSGPNRDDRPSRISAASSPDTRAPVEVFAPISGKIIAVLCEKGAAVTAGRVCVRLDPTPFEEAVAREKDALAAALQRQQASASAAAAATKDLERKQRAQGRGAPRPATEKARAVLERAMARAEADKAAVERARAALASAEAALAQVDIAAPVTGAVVSAASVGETVEAGKPPAAFSIAPEAAQEIDENSGSSEPADP